MGVGGLLTGLRPLSGCRRNGFLLLLFQEEENNLHRAHDKQTERQPLENGQQPLDDADESPEDVEAKSAANAEALEIFNRLQREAAEDEAKKAAEIAQARFEAAEKFEPADEPTPEA